MSEDIERIIDSVIQLWNTGNSEIAKKLYSDEAQRTDPNQPESARGSQEIARYVAEVRTGYPDFQLEIKDKVSEANRLVTHWICTGTHKGEFQGIPATGKRIKISGLALARIENGKIAEEHVYFDRLTMMEQLGVAPEMGQGRAKPAAR
ncbi:MAG TPA: ester cyclase [Bryobacteraceae bacterium]|nr:ester cyclase [Bryobacteraceae bacterium]